ncbi:hypothetical protein PYW07_009658 [Mythimna separata]|uniref:Thyroglobulin type-1 domain-containing protein n=1 Tax=Mythimna separata TaxID=271217 RepID=A0AAD7YBX1_MYTSE|nr:hypothetical protein PYW07_009658 [Mythimna separata]
MVPVLKLEHGGPRDEAPAPPENMTLGNQKYLTFSSLVDRDKDTSEFWRETEILSLIRMHSEDGNIDYDRCEHDARANNVVKIHSPRTVRPICRNRIDFQLCPQCPHFNNHTECELFRDSCKERRVHPSEYGHYCERKYGKWRAMFVPADYSQCRCCDECIFYRELDQSCVEDEYNFVTEEFLPTTAVDFRAGCNQYWGHPEQEFRALRCDKYLRRCVPVSVPQLPKGPLNMRRSFRYETATNEDCPISCLGYQCRNGLVPEKNCALGGFLPDKDQCNCCGKCSIYHQLNEKCAEFKKTFQKVNGTIEMEVEEEFLEPGCDDGLVCRQGRCQDIHAVMPPVGTRRKRDEPEEQANEPCKRELKYFKKKFGPDGHLHYNAPQCTPLWLYAPVQCRRFVCYCALEDGSFILGIKVPRVEVSNMNCDCAREKCRTGSDVECDGYGNYKEAVFTPHREDWKANEAPEKGHITTVTTETPEENDSDTTSKYVIV